MYPNIKAFCATLTETFNEIPATRQALLLQLSDYIRAQTAQGQTARIIVICTHNSRRSHIGQFMLAVAADYYGVSPVETYSGGTEATAFNPNAIAALQSVGFEITSDDAVAKNPRYQVRWSEGESAQEAFSKKFSAAPNPQEAFAAIMVCTEADEGCPFVPGAAFRLALPFDDPKAFDGTPLEAAKYLERTHDIGREMLFVLSAV